MQKLRVLHTKHKLLAPKTQEFCPQTLMFYTLNPKLLHLFAKKSILNGQKMRGHSK